jgi:hypothetical protein
MLLDQPALSDSSGASPASTMVRSGSEPPDINGVNGVNEVNGLRRARNPIKVAGITMGSQDNLDTVNDELADVFANRRRRRRSATPVKIGGITMGDPATEQSVLFSSFFICEPVSIVGHVKDVIREPTPRPPRQLQFCKYDVSYGRNRNTYIRLILVAVGSSGILKGKQKLGVTFNSDKLGSIDFTKISKLTMCSA